MEKEFRNKTILVTGGTGSIGSELVAQLLKFKPKQIRVLSRDESKQYYLQERLNYPKNLRLLIGDIRDKERLDLALRNVDIVFHAAALKHVPFCEYNPFETVKTNILGSQNIIDAALKYGVKKVVAISTDKAANPDNIMGTSKLMMEKLFINANYYTGKAETKFSCVRFGNVAWARGSVLPLWKNQAERKKTIHVTDKEMTRFLMTIDNAAKLVLKAAQLSHGGEIFILKMPAIKLADLANLFIKKHFPGQKIKIKVIGLRPGEKIHEELFGGNDQYKQILENKEMLIIVPNIEIYHLTRPLEPYPGFQKRNASSGSYSSKDSIDIKKIKKIV